MAKQDDYARITLRMPAALHARINDAREKANRSMNAEIIERLERSFDDGFMPGMSRGELAMASARAVSTMMGAMLELAVRRSFDAARAGESPQDVYRDIYERLEVEETGNQEFTFSLKP